MHESSPFYLFHPDSPGWLKRRHQCGEPVSVADVARIVSANPAYNPDPLFREYIVRALRGELKGKPGPKRSSARELKFLLCGTVVANLAARLTARRKRQKGKGIEKRRVHYSATELAEEVVARRWTRGPANSLRNELSARRNRNNSMSARPLVC